MIVTGNILALTALLGFAQASPAPQEQQPATTISASPLPSGSSIASGPKVLLWYKSTHRDDMALYPRERRDASGWQEISAAANALMTEYPDFITQAIFGASLENLPERPEPTTTPLRSTFQDSLSWDQIDSFIGPTSPAITLLTTGPESTSGPFIDARLNMTLFPLSTSPFSKVITFPVAETYLGDSSVTWPLALMAAYMDPEILKKLQEKGYPINPDPERELLNDVERIDPKIQAAKIEAAKAALFLLTGLDPVTTPVKKDTEFTADKFTSPNRALPANPLMITTSPESTEFIGPYVIKGPNIVSTYDGGLRSLYRNVTDWLLLDCRARMFPNDTKLIHDEKLPSQETDDQAFDRLLVYETPMEVIALKPEDVDKLARLKNGDPTEMSKLIPHPENFQFVAGESHFRRRAGSATAPFVSKRTMRP
ncbi:hypothetical protein QFC22_000829 [Naganishia vaughanmartiniae]|uniref:Uncharacterized protein n=1 Tax=Naganishia vaughanmartiniae TaxID=1424756 RepID=A0ACC2XKY8_9TREE|nr:hypothetical protein QFC22_000829 [Naganishia vaughanmartiniae]